MRESNFWLRILLAVENNSDELKFLINESNELKNILGKIRKNYPNKIINY